MFRRAIRLGTILVLALGPAGASAQAPTFTLADSLRGSNGPARAWWDVGFYDLNVRISPADSSIAGYNVITYRVVAPAPTGEMQIDLQAPLSLDSVTLEGQRLRAAPGGLRVVRDRPLSAGPR